jgi:hypothetical protein
VLIVIGSYMIAPITRIDFGDPTELVPAFLTIALIIFTDNIGVGMTARITTYSLLKTLSGTWREVPRGLWVLALPSFPSTFTIPTGDNLRSDSRIHPCRSAIPFGRGGMTCVPNRERTR